MEWMILIIVCILVWLAVWVFRTATAASPAPPARTDQRSSNPASSARHAPARVRRAEAPAPAPIEIDPALVADLRGLASTRYRIKGSAYVVSDENREWFGGTDYQLRREPKNRHDSQAIAVYGQGRKVGYISAAKAASIAPLLDQLSEVAFTVGGAGTIGNSIRLWVDVPPLPALRSYVKTRTGSSRPVSG